MGVASTTLLIFRSLPEPVPFHDVTESVVEGLVTNIDEPVGDVDVVLVESLQLLSPSVERLQVEDMGEIRPEELFGFGSNVEHVPS